MSNRIRAIVVEFDADVSEEYADAVCNAIRVFRHVQRVEPHVADWESAMADQRARNELGQKIFAVIYPNLAASNGR